MSNVLNEVNHGFRVPDFERRIGLSRQEADNLHSEILGSSPTENTRIKLSIQQLRALLNALTETLLELGVEEFSTRVGPSFEEGQRLRDEIESAIRLPRDPREASSSA